MHKYKSTLSYAKPLLRYSDLRQIGNNELRSFVRKIRETGAADATVDTHLRHLRAIFSAAIDEDLLERNPVTKFRRDLGLKVPRGNASYTDAELEALWGSMAKLKYKAVYIYICKASGARISELIALDWDDLDLLDKQLHILSQWDP